MVVDAVLKLNTWVFLVYLKATGSAPGQDWMVAKRIQSLLFCH